MAERINPCANQDCICNCQDCPITTGFFRGSFKWEVGSGGPAIHKTIKLDSEAMRARSAQRGAFDLQKIMRYSG